MSETASNYDPTKDSAARRKTQGLRRKFAEGIYAFRPETTANQITVLGTGALALSAEIAEKQNEQNPGFDILKTPNLVLAIVAAASDGIDGEYARLIQEKQGTGSSFVGGLVDNAADRIQERSLNESQARSAYKRGDFWGEKAAILCEVTNATTSTAKSIAEILGKSVPERGKGLLGDRLGRAVGAIPATIYPELVRIGPVSFETAVNSATAVCNIWTTADRLKRAFEPQEGKLSTAKRVEAGMRLATNLVLLKNNIDSALATYKKNRTPSN
jgi:hypothetical protein